MRALLQWYRYMCGTRSCCGIAVASHLICNLQPPGFVATVHRILPCRTVLLDHGVSHFIAVTLVVGCQQLKVRGIHTNPAWVSSPPLAEHLPRAVARVQHLTAPVVY